MIIDKFLQVSKDQAVTTSAASTDVIDLGQANPNLGNGEPLYLVVTVGQGATAEGSATVDIALQDSADNSSYANLVSTGAIGKAALVAGKQIVIPVPPEHRRYLRVNYTVATGPLTAGKFSAQIVAGYQLNRHYPDAL